jgi:hypothetical protein
VLHAPHVTVFLYNFLLVTSNPPTDNFLSITSDHDELRYSIRSILQHFTGHTTKLHVVTPDLGDAAGRRYGVLPQWLNFRDNSPDSDSSVSANSPGSSNDDDDDEVGAANAANAADGADRHKASTSSQPSVVPSTPWRDGGVELNVVHHSQIFKNLNNATFNRYVEMWEILLNLANTLPSSISSFSIESQLHGLTTVSDPL